MADVNGDTPPPGFDFPTYNESKAEWEKEYAERVMSAAGGNKSLAARMARKDRRTFYELLERTGLWKREP